MFAWLCNASPMGYGSAGGTCPAAERSWCWDFLTAASLWARGHLQAVLSRPTLANTDMVTLELPLFLDFASL